uniref:Melanocortin 2 receptor accessory protein 2b n=1 Tax=Hippocampus comes TaxID=109280 RepID=A0A3Q3DX05_HIPCM
MSSHNRSQSSARRGDYVWQYEYYDDEPVSFEGLKAHRYSIVIGFWVGLAVFVIFMFFVLTMLTKTGLTHDPKKDDDSDDNNAVSRAFLAESRSYFNFYISKEGEGKDRLPFDGLLADETRTDTDCDFLSHFNIPNFVTCEHNSSLGEDDPLSKGNSDCLALAEV